MIDELFENKLKELELKANEARQLTIETLLEAGSEGAATYIKIFSAPDLGSSEEKIAPNPAGGVAGSVYLPLTVREAPYASSATVPPSKPSGDR